MSVTKNLTAGDKGVKFSGPFTDAALIGLADLTGWTARFTLLNEAAGGALIADAAATIGEFDPLAGSVRLSYTHPDPLVAGKGKVRFTLVDPSGDVKHGPSNPLHQTFIAINL